MQKENTFEVIIIGGSYAGLAAGMALGRAMRKVLIIDSGQPCNRQTPYSHNFITHDGSRPADILAAAKVQVAQYSTLQPQDGYVISAAKTPVGFTVQTAAGKIFISRKLIIATGISDKFPAIQGFSESWGISVLHCPYCHGYEVRGKATGILANGEAGFGYTSLIFNWTNRLTVYTNGHSAFSPQQAHKLQLHSIHIVEEPVKALLHIDGRLQHIQFANGHSENIEVLYAQVPFTQHSGIAALLGCAITPEGYIQVSQTQATTVKGVYACGDNSSKMRTIASAVASGTTAGMMANKELIEESF